MPNAQVTTANTKTNVVAKTDEIATTSTTNEAPVAKETPEIRTENDDQTTQNNEDNEDTETDIPVPATGEIAEPTEAKSPLPLFAAIIAGAAAVSIVIAAILHRQPRSRF